MGKAARKLSEYASEKQHQHKLLPVQELNPFRPREKQRYSAVLTRVDRARGVLKIILIAATSRYTVPGGLLKEWNVRVG